MDKNVFGKPLKVCCLEPMTGYFRDGFCRSDLHDRGTHTVCAIMTKEFLNFSASKGNDLISPNSFYKFPGLKEGDKWCLCVLRWIEAEKYGKAPKLILEATHEKTLEYLSLNKIVKYAVN